MDIWIRHRWQCNGQSGGADVTTGTAQGCGPEAWSCGPAAKVV